MANEEGYTNMKNMSAKNMENNESDMSHTDYDTTETNHSQMNMNHGDMDMAGADMMMYGGLMIHMGNLKVRFRVSVVLAIPVLLSAPVMGLNASILSFNSPPIAGITIVLFDTALHFYGGTPFLKGAKAEIQNKSLEMMTLVTLGISVSYFYSLYAFIVNNFLNPTNHIMDFSFELATLILIMSLGHWIEMNAPIGVGNALQETVVLLLKTAHPVTDNGETKEVPVSDLKVGQAFQVHSGESIPADGVITAGESTVSGALVADESVAATKNTGDKVTGDTANNSGMLTVKINGTGDSNYLSQVMKMAQGAQQAKSKAEDKADLVAKYLFYAALGVGIIAFLAWSSQGLATAMTIMVIVFVIACPHASGLVIPLVVSCSTIIGTQNGLLVRNRQATEASQHVSHALLDKIGMLTGGKSTVNVLIPNDEIDEATLLSRLAALEINSVHPLAQAIIIEAQAKNIEVVMAEKSQNISDVGIFGNVDGTDYMIVNGNYLTKQGTRFDGAAADKWATKGNSVSFLFQGTQAQGTAAEGDTIKAGAKELISGLQRRGITPIMLTGDNPRAAERAANLLGLTEFHTGLSPDDKQEIIADYQAKGNHVAMVGDGVNDAPSLAAADIRIATGARTDVATDSADAVSVRSEPSDILHSLDLAKITDRKMVQNLWWGAGYNVVAVPLVAGVSLFIGIILDPTVGAAIMAMSTIIVITNAMGSTGEKIRNV